MTYMSSVKYNIIKHLYGIIPYLLTRHLVSTILLNRYGIIPYKKKEENNNGYHSP